MKTYCAYDSGFFNIRYSQEVMKWKLLGTDISDAMRDYNIKMIKESYGFKVKSYEVREIPRCFKKNKFDHAKLLILTTEGNDIVAKRYNNNQKFKIRI